MANFTQSELDSIREVVTCHLSVASKLSSCANSVSDGEIKQMLIQSAQEAKQNAQNLMRLL
ncbi:MAG: hypothetical protein LBS21_05640 [Clostridiales bacterium]|jgi:hypothetical protein|nr:hypothetical protein [Clostridiales bacterium]